MKTYEEKEARLRLRYERLGYEIESEPLHVEDWLAALQRGLDRLEHRLTVYAELYGTRGASRRALGYLHHDIPCPVWGVCVRRSVTTFPLFRHAALV